MKKTLSMILLAASFMAMQACGSKSTENNAAVSTHEDSVKNGLTEENTEVKLTRAEKKAQLAEQTARREERRRLAFEEQTKLNPTFIDSKGKVVYNKAEVDPSFIGGNDAMMKYLNDNIQFPKDAETEGLEGTVFVDFIITEAGDVREVNVINEIDEDVDQRFRDEAIRVVSAMPKWTPGTQRGKPVEVMYSLPISFEIR
ncbi:MAG TPA: energy transducer TonB [Chryseolinea sp.]|nr:energy transducer TonB [Chryseolinea sp.]HPH46370.1 energy transducer TonB [Chryseolinea sp.]HPM32541.1 energy transducer TonB [Chryseolinea sp.]